MKLFLNTLFGILLSVNISFAQFEKPSKSVSKTEHFITNPILKGFYPDPSICRVKDDYYIVNSSFEYFPGIPIFHSKDLANWEQIGYVLNRPEQLDLDSIRVSGGVYAPTIRFHNDTFYVINTLIGKGAKGGNYYVYATNPAGPWSNPIWLKDAPGIDPSLFFDNDEKVYCCGNGRPADNTPDSKKRHIWVQELDLKTQKLVGEKSIILVGGAMVDAANAESPHIYKKGIYYYLMIAEGGTGDNHAVTIFRSKNIRGPYEANRKNPILTHRNLGRNYPIACTGHADLFDTQNGKWWMVLLGVRPYGGFHYNLGRETFIAPVIWEDGWPIVCPNEGKVLFKYPQTELNYSPVAQQTEKDDFNADNLSYKWNFLRTPRKNFWSLKERKGFLRLHLLPDEITELVSPAFIGRRQEDTSFSASVNMSFVPKNDSESAGLVLFMNKDYQFRFEKTSKSSISYLTVTRRYDGIDSILASMKYDGNKVILGVCAHGQNYGFKYSSDNINWKVISDKVDGRTLSRTNAGGFTGAYIGLYATSKNQQSNNFADFDWFTYKGEE